MVHIMVDVDLALLHAAQAILETDDRAATISRALGEVVRRKQIEDSLEALNSVEMDYSGSEKSFRYGGGRDLTKLDEKARAYAAELADRERDTWISNDPLIRQAE